MAMTVNSGGTCGSRWTPNFRYVQNKLNESFGVLLSQLKIFLKKKKKKKKKKNTARTRN